MLSLIKKNSTIILFLIFFLFSFKELQQLISSDNNVTRHSCKKNEFKTITILPGFQSPFSECGAELIPTFNAIGGGEYYKNVISKLSSIVVVTKVPQLLKAINSAHSGDTIYLDDNYVFDISEYAPIKIKNALTIASGRGKGFSQGALIINKNIFFGNKNNPNSIFEISHDSVRITGLRIEGPHSQIIYQKPNQEPQSCGIWFRSINYGVVDNCEIYFLYYSGIVSTVSKNVYIHHNSIHHCHGKGLGYGILVSRNSEVLIEANLFENNRHDIAADGSIGDKYEARFNLIKSCSEKNQHSFDMHCIGESKYNCDSTHNIGGSVIIIYNNTWLDNRQTAIKIRGNPSKGCYIEKNRFIGYENEEAIKYNPFVTKIYVDKNCYEKNKNTNVK